jgi:carboxyl-terminal processing protease
MILGVRLVILPLTLLVASSLARAQDITETELSDAEKLYGLSLIWKEADYNFPLFERLSKLDWDSAYQAFIPQVLEAETTIEYYRVLIRFAALLRDGHTTVSSPPWVFQQHVFDQPKIRLSAVQGRAIVWNVEDTLAVRIPIGSEVVAVDGVPVQEYLEREVYPFLGVPTERFRRSFAMAGWYVNGIGLLWGESGSSVNLTLQTADGDERSVTVLRDSFSRRATWARSFPPREPFQFRWLEDDVAYVALNTFSDWAQVERFDSIAPELHRAAGVIIDVRRNGGGNNGVARRIIARHLARDTLVGARWRTRINNAAYRAWGRYTGQEWAREYWPYYTGKAWHEGEPETVVPDTSFAKLEVPIVVLIGRNTGSAAEDFLVWLSELDNVTFVGEPTTGSTGQALGIDLPGGGSARILTKHDAYPDGREFLGIGIQPDVFVERTVEDVVHDRDGMLERALAVVREQLD